MRAGGRACEGPRPRSRPRTLVEDEVRSLRGDLEDELAEKPVDPGEPRAREPLHVVLPETLVLDQRHARARAGGRARANEDEEAG